LVEAEEFASISSLRRSLAEYDSLEAPSSPTNAQQTEHERLLFEIAEKAYGLKAQISETDEPDEARFRSPPKLVQAVVRPTLARSVGALFSITTYPTPISTEQDWSRLDAVRKIQDEIATRTETLLELRYPDYQEKIQGLSVTPGFDKSTMDCLVQGCWKSR
jgi:hypothetical protein